MISIAVSTVFMACLLARFLFTSYAFMSGELLFKKVVLFVELSFTMLSRPSSTEWDCFLGDRDCQAYATCKSYMFLTDRFFLFFMMLLN